MSIFDRRPALEKEWERLMRKEEEFLCARMDKKDTLLNRTLAEKVPEKLQETLDAAFYKAFCLIFEKGTALIEKTYNRPEMEKTFQVDEYAEEVRRSRKELRRFDRKAGRSGSVNLMISGLSGIGMGLVGVGIPDIPLFTGMMLRSVYEIALRYGYDYDVDAERWFILCLIEGAVSYGSQLSRINQELDDFIRSGFLPDGATLEKQTRRTAEALSGELLYMKFLQGIPVVGAVGGAYDIIYMKQINAYAGLKYRRRFLLRRLSRRTGVPRV